MSIKSEYTKNIITLITGNTISQAIPIVISPILTRIYTPEDFGLAGLFGSITMLLAAMVNAKYEAAIVLPKNDKDAYSIARLSLLICSIISFILLIIILIFHEQILTILGTREIDVWLYFIPLVVFLSGLYNVLNFLNTRDKNFKALSKVQIYKATSTGTFQILVGSLKSGAFGLIGGQILSNFVGNFILIKKTKLFQTKVTKYQIKDMAKKYKNFPLYFLPNNLVFYSLNTFNNIFISSIFGIGILGFYNMANRILGIPGTVLGNSIGQVYLQHASNELSHDRSIKNLFTNTLKKLVIVGVPIYLFSFFFMGEIFSFVFGEKWETAGVYAEILAPLFFIRFISTSLNSTTLVLEKQQIELALNTLILIILIIIFFITNKYNLKIEFFLYLFTSLIFIIYFIKLTIYYHIVNRDDQFKNNKIHL